MAEAAGAEDAGVCAEYDALYVFGYAHVVGGRGAECGTVGGAVGGACAGEDGEYFDGVYDGVGGWGV